MSRTLFIYVFRDMVRIFLLALLTLAVIMSFGGLLRPLTRQGLEAAQIGAALAYLLPAMMTYALPIAALFATTFVYGRLSADNEITACRAGGISYLSMVAPAFLLGLIVSIISLLMLCFIVPGLTLKVEQLATSNVAKYIAFQIERQHEVSFPNWPYTVFAQSAYMPPQPPDKQIVVLRGPMVVTYDHRAVPPVIGAKAGKATGRIRVPKNFWMAQQATLYITNIGGNQLRVSGQSENGTMFERMMRGDRGGTAEATFGPTIINAGVREHPKFMDIRQLKDLLANRSQSQRIQDAFASLIRKQQETDYLAHLVYMLKTAGTYTFDTGAGLKYVLSNPTKIEPTSNGRDQLALKAPKGRPLRLVEQQHGMPTLTATASQVQIQVHADTPNKQMVVLLHVTNAQVAEGGIGDDTGGTADLDRRIYCPMSRSIAAVAHQTLAKYLNGPDVPMDAPVALRHEIVQVTNYIYSEMHGRVAFAVSCLILVAVGAALGLMFKSGNFLSAFAVSVAPALLAIALIATGQHVVEGVPWIVTPANDPVNLGIAIIWSGNLAALIVGAILLGRLQRK